MDTCASEERGEGIRESIDQSYLKSNQYQAFEKRVQQEQQRSATHKEQFVKIIVDQLMEDGDRKMALPATIDVAHIEKILTKNQHVPPSVIRIFGSRYRYYSLATIEVLNMHYYLFMLCEIVGYDNCTVWFSTIKNDTIIDFESIAVYSKSVSYEETSQIQFNENEIHVETIRRVKNPFEQTNRITKQYNILPSGEIYQINN